MSHSAYPTSSDLGAYLKGLNILDPTTQDAVLAGIDLSQRVGAAIEDWEHDVDWRPFYAPTYAITGATNTSPIVVTCEDHPLRTGMEFLISGVTGNTAANGYGVATRLSADTFSIDGSTGNGDYLSGGTLELTRRFDPPGPATRFNWRGGGKVLALGGGLLSVSRILVGVSSSYAGYTLTAGEDYWLEPADAPYRGYPYTQVRFSWHRTGLPQSVRITGVWGFCDSIGGDVWEAILARAAVLCYPQISLTVGNVISSVETLSTKVSYAKALSDQKAAWEKTYAEAVAEHKFAYM